MRRTPMRLCFCFLVVCATLAGAQIDPNDAKRYPASVVVPNGAGTADARITASIATLPSSGGYVDAGGLIGAQTWAACPTWGNNPVTLEIGAAIHTMAVNCTVPVNVTIKATHGGIFCPASGTTLTINGPVGFDSSQHFCGPPGVVTFAGLHPAGLNVAWWTGIGSTGGLQEAINATVGIPGCTEIVLPTGYYSLASLVTLPTYGAY